MIYTVTFNPALDYIVFLDGMALGEVNRATRELIFYGGKGINVSTVLNMLGQETTALGFIAMRSGSFDSLASASAAAVCRSSLTLAPGVLYSPC